MKPKASVIVPTCGRPALLRDALRSLQAQDMERDSFEVIVVDNGPLDSAGAAGAGLDVGEIPCVRVCYEPRVGLHHARHRGATEAAAELLVFVDDDVVCPARWLAELLAPYEDPKVAATGGPVFPRWQAPPPQWIDDLGLRSYLSLLDLGREPGPLVWPDHSYGCNMSVRKSVMVRVGGFNPDGFADPRLIWYRGDGESGLLRKVHESGWTEYYQPSAWLEHCIPASRLTREYFFRRAFAQGISDSFTRLREGRASGVSRLRWLVADVISEARCTAGALRARDERRIDLMIRASLARGRVRHQLMMLVNSQIRRHVRKETYLDG